MAILPAADPTNRLTFARFFPTPVERDSFRRPLKSFILATGWDGRADPWCLPDEPSGPPVWRGLLGRAGWRPQTRRFGHRVRWDASHTFLTGPKEGSPFFNRVVMAVVLLPADALTGCCYAWQPMISSKD